MYSSGYSFYGNWILSLYTYWSLVVVETTGRMVVVGIHWVDVISIVHIVTVCACMLGVIKLDKQDTNSQWLTLGPVCASQVGQVGALPPDTAPPMHFQQWTVLVILPCLWGSWVAAESLHSVEWLLHCPWRCQCGGCTRHPALLAGWQHYGPWGSRTVSRSLHEGA